MVRYLLAFFMGNHMEPGFSIRPANFDSVLPIWRDKLWPGRNSKIEATSHIAYAGGFDADLADAKAHFWRAETPSGEVVGVISGFATSLTMFRSRGIWVDPLWRKRGLGRSLLQAVHSHARDNGYARIWTMPRLSAWPFYQACGYRISRETDEFEFGPHYIAVRDA